MFLFSRYYQNETWLFFHEIKRAEICASYRIDIWYILVKNWQLISNIYDDNDKFDIQFDLGGVICRGTYMSSFSSSTRRLASSVEEVSPLSMAESLETDRELLKDNNRINSLITLSQMKYRNRLMNIKSKNGKSICIFVQDSIIFKFPSV